MVGLFAIGSGLARVSVRLATDRGLSPGREGILAPSDYHAMADAEDARVKALEAENRVLRAKVIDLEARLLGVAVGQLK